MVWLGLSSGSGFSFERAEVRTWICNGVVANGYNANGRDSAKAGNEHLEAVLIAGVVRPIQPIRAILAWLGPLIVISDSFSRVEAMTYSCVSNSHDATAGWMRIWAKVFAICCSCRMPCLGNHTLACYYCAKICSHNISCIVEANSLQEILFGEFHTTIGTFLRCDCLHPERQGCWLPCLAADHVVDLSTIVNSYFRWG